MVRVRLLLAMAVLAFCIGQAAYAVSDFEWSPTDYDCNLNPIREGVPCLVHDFDWQYDVGGAYKYEMYGEPPSPNDPDVSQKVRNLSAVKWTDWHVEIANAYILVGSGIVYNVQVPSPQWVVDYSDFYVPGSNQTLATGFFAHVVSGQGTEVNTMQQLSVFFSYDLDGSGQTVSINQYPTDTYAIPEPSSLLALFGGLAAMAGYRIRRRS